MKEKKKELTDHKVKLIVMAILTIIVAIAVPLAIKIISNISFQNQTPIDPPTNPPEETLVPVLSVPENITIDKFTTNHKFEYTVTDLGDYEVSITIQNTNIATLNLDNYIIPAYVGTTNIITEINCEPKITKTTTLYITDAVTDINYEIKDENNQIPNKFFVGNTYTLEICENANMSNPPNLGYLNEYISEFEFVNKNDNVSTYTFKIIKAGEFSFYYNEKYCQKYIELTSYIFPTDINVTFSNITFKNNITNLYLFNNEYLDEANKDGYYHETEFYINLPTNVYDDIDFKVNGSSIIINDNKITAVNEGKSSITFTSSVSGLTKTFEFNVSIVQPTSIRLNSTTYNINDIINLDLALNIPFEFISSISPNYALGELKIETSNNIAYANNQLTLTSTETGLVKIKFNDNVLLTCNINLINNYKVDISLYLNSNNITLENDTLKFILDDSNIILLNCRVMNTLTNIDSDIALTIEIIDTNIITGTTSNNFIEIKNGLITLSALKTGNTKIVFSNTQYDIYYELKIEISE